jgi:hypothetical protein
MANRLLNSARFRNKEDGGKMAPVTALSELTHRTFPGSAALADRPETTHEGNMD